MLEHHMDPETKWYVNNQYVVQGTVITFYPKEYLYSADNNQFIIAWICGSNIGIDDPGYFFDPDTPY